jgi:hypothetical protein
VLLGGWVRLLLGWQDYYPPPTQSPAQLPPGFSTPRLFSDLTALRVSKKTPTRRPVFRELQALKVSEKSEQASN